MLLRWYFVNDIILIMETLYKNGGGDVKKRVANLA